MSGVANEINDSVVYLTYSSLRFNCSPDRTVIEIKEVWSIYFQSWKPRCLHAPGNLQTL